MRRIVFRTLLLVAVVFTVSRVNAADDPFKAIPSDASAVIHIKAPLGLGEKVAGFAQQVDPALAGQARGLSAMVGALVSNPTLGGIEQRGDWWVAAFSKKESPPGIVFAVPTSDLDALKQAVGDAFEFVSFENWALYTEDAETAKKIQQQIAGSKPGIGSVIDKQSRAIIDAADASMYINVAVLAEMYKEELQEGREQFLGQLEMLPQVAPQSGMNLKAIVDMYRTIFDLFFQGLEDCDGCVVAATIGKESLSFDDYLHVKSDTKTAKWLASSSTSSMELIGKLPADQAVYFGAHGDAQSLAEWGMKMSLSMLNDNPDSKQALEDAMAAIKKLKFGDYVGSFTLGDLETGAMRMTTAIEVTPSTAMRDLSRKMGGMYEKFSIPGLKQELKIEEDAEAYGDQKVDVMTMKQEFTEEIDPFGMQNKMVQAMWGPDGMKSRIAYLKGLVVQSVGGGRTQMAALLKSINADKANTDNAAMQSVRGRLAPKANLVVLIDLPSLVVEGIRMAVKSGQLPIPISEEMLDDLKIERSYLGFTVATEPQGIRVKTDVPAAQIKSGYDLVKFFMQLAQAPAI